MKWSTVALGIGATLAVIAVVSRVEAAQPIYNFLFAEPGK
jgi:hypothetical protein